MLAVREITREEWAIFSEDAHKVVFKEFRPKDTDRIDFAILGLRDQEMVGWATVREISKTYCYIQYGGVLDNVAGTVGVYLVYQLFLDYLRTRYKEVSTLVSAENTAMLRLAMKGGLRIIGCRCFKEEVMCELYLEF